MQLVFQLLKETTGFVMNKSNGTVHLHCLGHLIQHHHKDHELENAIQCVTNFIPVCTSLGLWVGPELINSLVFVSPAILSF